MVEDNELEINQEPDEEGDTPGWTFMPGDISEMVGRPYGTSFRQTPKIDRLAEALARAQTKIRPAERNAMNPHFRSKYADLASVMSAVMPSLTEAGICVIQGAKAEHTEQGTLVVLSTRLMHSSGQWIESETSAYARGGDPQAVGSVITYLKRYGISAMVGCAADEDDDAEGAYSRDGQRQQGGGRPQGGKPQGGKPPQGPRRLSKKDQDAILAAFDGFNINREKLEEKLGKKIADWTEDDRRETVKLYKELENGSAAEDLFGVDIAEPKEAPAKEEPGADG